MSDDELDVEAAQKRLDDLGHDIEEARKDGREALGEPGPNEPMYHDSGDHPEADDQTIAPPG